MSRLFPRAGRFVRNSLITFSTSLCLVLTACGGGSNDQASAGEAAAPNAKTAATSAVVGTIWTHCANENGSCVVPATSVVRYGANGKYSTRSATGSIQCSNSVFGDPSPGVAKGCDYSAPPPAAVASTATWTRCSYEWGVCTIQGTQQVRFGANGRYATKVVTNSIACTNTVFGDPAPNVAKTCEYSPIPAPVPPPLTWVLCAAEWGTCKFTGTQDVRYGANGLYNTKTATNSIACNNMVFGDPAAGQTKVCQILGVATAPPVVTTVITDSIFAPTSFWYQPVPATVALHPNNAGYVAEFLRQIATYYNAVNIGTGDYTSPVYVVDAATPTTPVTYADCGNQGYTPYDLAQQWSAVPIPTYAAQAGGNDGEMTIYQPSSDTLWEFWQGAQTNGQWRACWGGRMQNASTSNGIWTFPFGTTATGLPFIGGQITAEELQRGEIRHVIGMSLVDLEDAAQLSWPANRSDGRNPNHIPNRIPQGTRFRLDPSIDIDSLAMHPIGKIIAKAAQKYGFVIWDTAGMVSMRAQNASSYTLLGKPDPYVALFNGAQSTALFNNFPWDRLQFLPKDYGKPTP